MTDATEEFNAELEYLRDLEKEKRLKDAKTKGADWNKTTPGAMGASFVNALQGPAFGFMDELAGLGSGIVGSIANLTPWGDDKTFAENYTAARDQVRGATDQFAKERPATSMATQLMASAPLMAAGTPGALYAGHVPKAAPHILSTGQKIYRTAKGASGWGAASGLGDSEADTVGGVLTDTAEGAAMSALMGGGMQGAGSAMVGAKNIVSPYIANVISKGAKAVGKSSGKLRKAMETGAENIQRRFEQLQLAKALRRSMVGKQDPTKRAMDRMGKLGDEARVVDAIGVPGYQTLDTVAQMPGQAKNLVVRAQTARGNQRYDRLAAAADDALGATGLPYRATMKELVKAQKELSGPLYAEMRKVMVTVDDALMDMWDKMPAQAKKLAADAVQLQRGKAARDAFMSIKPGDQWDLETLSLIKVGLQAYEGEMMRNTGPGNLIPHAGELRRAITSYLDDISPKIPVAGGKKGEMMPLYEAARNAYAGPAGLQNAMEAGKKVWQGQNEDQILDVLEAISTKSEMEAFRVGAAQGLKNLIGTQAGQTKLLTFAKNRNMQKVIKAVFGVDVTHMNTEQYRQFIKTVLGEQEMKGFMRVSHGSDTFARQQHAADMRGAGDAASAAASLMHGDPFPTLKGASRFAARTLHNERQRDALAKMLLLRGDKGRAAIKSTDALVRALNAKSAAASGAIGAETGRYYDGLEYGF